VRLFTVTHALAYTLEEDMVQSRATAYTVCVDNNYMTDNFIQTHTCTSFQLPCECSSLQLQDASRRSIVVTKTPSPARNVRPVTYKRHLDNVTLTTCSRNGRNRRQASTESAMHLNLISIDLTSPISHTLGSNNQIPTPPLRNSAQLCLPQFAL